MQRGVISITPLHGDVAYDVLWKICDIIALNQSHRKMCVRLYPVVPPDIALRRCVAGNAAELQQQSAATAAGVREHDTASAFSVGDEPDTLRMWRQAITPPKHVKHDDGDNVTISRGTARAYTPAPAGTVSDHQPGGHDDLANAICGVIVQLAKPDAMTIWRRLGRPAGAAA